MDVSAPIPIPFFSSLIERALQKGWPDEQVAELIILIADVEHLSNEQIFDLVRDHEICTSSIIAAIYDVGCIVFPDTEIIKCAFEQADTVDAFIELIPDFFENGVFALPQPNNPLDAPLHSLSPVSSLDVLLQLGRSTDGNDVEEIDEDESDQDEIDEDESILCLFALANTSMNADQSFRLALNICEVANTKQQCGAILRTFMSQMDADAKSNFVCDIISHNFFLDLEGTLDDFLSKMTKDVREFIAESVYWIDEVGNAVEMDSDIDENGNVRDFIDDSEQDPKYDYDLSGLIDSQPNEEERPNGVRSGTLLALFSGGFAIFSADSGVESDQGADVDGDDDNEYNEDQDEESDNNVADPAIP